MAIGVGGALDTSNAVSTGTASCLERGGPRVVRVPRWMATLALFDLVGGALGASAGLLVRFGDTTPTVMGVRYGLVAALLPVAWLLMLWGSGAYRPRVLAAGHEEYQRVINAGVYLVAGIAFLSFALHADASRGFVAVSLPTATALTLLGRFRMRKALQTSFARGRALHRAIVVGSRSETMSVVAHMRRAHHAGFSVVGAMTTDGGDTPLPGVEPVHGAPSDLPRLAALAGADTIAVAGSSAMTGPELRQLSWNLEGTGIQLVVAPAVTDVAGPRIVVRPVDGLPLLHVDEPEFHGARRIAKAAIERMASALLLLLLSPVLLAIAVAIRVGSRGPVLYRQRRVGLHGADFTLVKFRTMYVGAHGDVGKVAHLDARGHVLFKVRTDPRVTRVGHFLRRHSLDELPQLWNVVAGSMSLVGPRPPLPEEVARYREDARRRLLVKPGMTGLWQVSGRADLSWDESVRLDLYYVENWSVALDALVLWKTFAAVMRGRGAY